MVERALDADERVQLQVFRAATEPNAPLYAAVPWPSSGSSSNGPAEAEKEMVAAANETDRLRQAKLACDEDREIAEERQRAVLVSPAYRDAKSLGEIEERLVADVAQLERAEHRLREAEIHRNEAVAARDQADHVRVGAWLDQVRTTGLARRLAHEHEGDAVSRVLDTLSAIWASNGRLRLAVLAAEVTGDSHGLDRGKPAGTLAVHALSWLSEQTFPRDALDWRRTWSEAGVACDDLSCDVLVLNLPGHADQPLRLTLRQALSW